MRQAHRSLISMLLALAVGAGLVALALWDRDRGESQRVTEAQRLKPLRIDPGSVDRIDIARAEQTIALERRGDQWHLTAPVQDLADNAVVGGILNAAADLKLASRFDAEAPAPEDLELAPPSVTVTLHSGAEASVVQLGRRSSFDGRVYVRAGVDPTAEPIGMIDASAASAMDKELAGLRERRLCPLSSNDISAVTVRQGAAASGDAVSFRLVRGDGATPPRMQWNDPWRVETPAALDADREVVSEILSQLTSARYSEVVSDAPGPELGVFGLDAPQIEVVLEVNGGQRRIALGVAADDGGMRRYAQRSGITAITDAPQQLYDALSRSLFELEDKRLLGIDEVAVHKIKLMLADNRLAVIERAREDGGSDLWSVLSPRPGPAKSWRVSSMLRTLLELKATEFAATGLEPSPGAAALRAFGLDAPQRSVTLFGADDIELATLHIGKPSGELVHVMRRGGERVALVERARLDDIPAELDELAESVVAEDAGR